MTCLIFHPDLRLYEPYEYMTDYICIYIYAPEKSGFLFAFYCAICDVYEYAIALRVEGHICLRLS